MLERLTQTNKNDGRVRCEETIELLAPLGKAFADENYAVRLEGHVETWLRSSDPSVPVSHAIAKRTAKRS